MNLWVLDVLHPKRKRSQFKEQVVVIAETAHDAETFYRAHLEDLFSDTPKAPRPQIVRVAEYKCRFVSRGYFKYDSKEKPMAPLPFNKLTQA
jgi:hypothetical protein